MVTLGEFSLLDEQREAKINLKLQFCRAKCLYKTTRNPMKGINIMKDIYRHNVNQLLNRATSLALKTITHQGRRLDLQARLMHMKMQYTSNY